MAVTERGFLMSYRGYESAVREAVGVECREYENQCDGVRGERLRFCRQVRNYLSHADDKGFVGLTQKMVDCLDAETDMLRGKADNAKRHAKRGLVFKQKDRVDDAVRAMAKVGSNWCAVEDGKGGHRVVSLAEASIAALDSKRTALGTVGGCKKVHLCDWDVEIDEVNENEHWLVLDKNGAIMGALVR